MNYPDTVKLAQTSRDGYGDRTITVVDHIPASFIKRAGIVQGANTEGETSDATVYLLPTHPSVASKLNDLEGMYIQSAPFTESNWYRISSVTIAQRKLLNNAIDNVYCRLEKVAGLAYDQSSNIS